MGRSDSKGVARKRSQADPFNKLTWDELQEWAGAAIVSRGQSYQRSQQVQELARTPRGGLVAWVQGTRRYATGIEAEDEALISACTCPYGGVCKLAVAVVLDYLEQVKHNRAIPTAPEQDRRLQLLQNNAAEEEWDAEHDEDEADEEIEHTPQRPSRTVAADALSEFLEQQTKPQLLALLKDLAQRDPDVRRFLQDRHNL